MARLSQGTTGLGANFRVARSCPLTTPNTRLNWVSVQLAKGCGFKDSTFLMDAEPGDDYLRRIAAFIRTHEANLAEAGFTRRRRVQRSSSTTNTAPSTFNPMMWFNPATSAPSSKPLVLSLDTHHLFYILMRLEALGVNVGSLDVKVDNPSRPMSFVGAFSEKTDTLSVFSIRSLSAVSSLSLGAGWFGRPAPPSLDAELKYLYSCLTKLPALAISAPGNKIIKEMVDESPNENAIPLDAFKNLQSLECQDIDPRTLLGWDRLAESLRSLTIKRSGVEDVSDIFIKTVIEDQARREGARDQTYRSLDKTRRSSFQDTSLPHSVPEEGAETRTDEPTTPTPISKQKQKASEQSQETSESPQDDPHSSSPTAPYLSSFKWAYLKHLSLSDNALTFFPTSPLSHLTSITHLDLTSNLLVSVPPGLSVLHNLTSLNLSDNMIDSVLGIYTNLGQILNLNLSRNRLDSICGLERLLALERVDLRWNRIEESAEAGRLALLPNITEVWVEGNPFVEYEHSYRITCFNYFWKEGKIITLDGSLPGFYEKRYLTKPPPHSIQQPVPLSPSSPVVPVTTPFTPIQITASKSLPLPGTETNASLRVPPTPPGSASPQLVGRQRRKNKRVIDLDGEHSDSTASPIGHTRTLSAESERFAQADTGDIQAASSEAADTAEPLLPIRPVRPAVRSMHIRHRSEAIPSASQHRLPSPETSPPGSPQSATPPQPRGSSTVAVRSSRRRARVTASVFEPTAQDSGPEEYRKRIEALRKDMGEGWLKVFSQSHLGGVEAGAL
jgi:Leucine-rich repeat (LRR) protein